MSLLEIRNMNLAPRLAMPYIESLEPRLAPAGIITVSQSNGTLIFTGDGSDNAMEITSPTLNVLSIKDPHAGEEGAVPTLFRIAGQADSSTLVLPTFQSIKVILGGGNDEFNASALFMNGAVTVLGGDGNDEISLSGTYNGAILLDGGNANDKLGISGVINNTVTMKGGTGDDEVFFGSGNYARGITADLGAGSNDFTLYSDATANIFGNISVSASGGATNTQSYFIGIETGSITGSVSFKTAAGSADHFFGGDETDVLTIYGNLTVTGAAGADAVLFAGKVSVGNAVNLNLGAGANFASNGITGGESLLSFIGLGSLNYTGTTGTDQLYFDVAEFIVAGNLNFNGGAGVNSVALINSTGTLIGGAMNYTGGTGNDQMNLEGAELTLGGKLTFKGGGGEDKAYVTNVLASIGSVQYTGGSGLDIFYLGAPDGTTTTVMAILGDVNLNAGTGAVEMGLSDALVHGKVVYASNVALNNIEPLRDIFFVTDSYISGTLSVNATGTASTEVYIDDSVLVSNVGIATGAGNDLVAFDITSVGSEYKNTFYGSVLVSLGTGNDEWQAGSATAAATLGNDFRYYVMIDGGAGSNTAFYNFDNNGSNVFASLFPATFPNMILV
jgi:hypothetical protein